MKNQSRFFLAAALALLTIVPSLAQAKENAQQIAARKAIAAAYARTDTALMKKDIRSAMMLFAPDFQNYGSSGRPENRAQYEAEMRYIFASPIRILKSGTKIKSLTWRGSDAIVISESTVVIVPSNGLKRRLEMVGVSRDYWSPSSHGWQMRQSVSRGGTSWIDGKQVK